MHLHHFLKNWPVSRRTTKQAIGRFYMAIDSNFRQMRADNAYRLIEQLQDGAEFMSYGKDCADLTASTQQEEAIQVEVIPTQLMDDAKASSQQIKALKSKCAQLKQQFEKSQKEMLEKHCRKLSMKKKDCKTNVV